MIMQILTHTPPFVFALFAFLVFMGWLQSRPRTINLPRLLIVPCIMIALSLTGVLTSFGFNSLSLSFWMLGVVIAIALHWALKYPKEVIYNKEAQTFSIEGGWIPFALMMLIFFTKYFVGASTAMHPEIKNLSGFVMSICLILGFASGSFFSRAFFILKKAWN